MCLNAKCECWASLVNLCTHTRCAHTYAPKANRNVFACLGWVCLKCTMQSFGLFALFPITRVVRAHDWKCSEQRVYVPRMGMFKMRIAYFRLVRAISVRVSGLRTSLHQHCKRKLVPSIGAFQITPYSASASLVSLWSFFGICAHVRRVRIPLHQKIATKMPSSTTDGVC